jgi:hypothetical protein
MIIGPDARQAPFSELVVGLRQGPKRGPFNACEQIAPTQFKPVHDVAIYAFE